MISLSLETVDRIFAFALWWFLGALLLFLLFALSRLRRRRRRLGELYAGGELDLSPKTELGRSLLNQWRILLGCVLAALSTSLVAGLALAFLPILGFQPAAGDLPQVLPLRLTALEYDRFYEGFKLDGEVWNQTETPLSGLEVVVTIIGLKDETLAELPAPVSPSPLPPGTAGTFRFEYRENSPFIKGYRVSFRDAAGTSLPHTAGFDVP
jgi:hypothetical protein